MKTLSIVAIVASLVFLVSPSEATAGMRITVTEETLQNVNQAELNALRNDLIGKRFDDASDNSGDLTWRISNIYIPYVGDFEPNINLRSDGQITWTCYISSISVKANWKARQDLGWFGSASADGSIKATVDRTSISISLVLSENNGGLGIRLNTCYARVGHLDLDFSGGGILDLVLDSLSDFFRNDLEKLLSKEICKQVEKGLTELSEDMKDIETSFPIKVIGIPLSLDNSFTKIAVSSDTISTYHKGAIQWNGQTFQSFDSVSFPSGETDLGIAFDLKDTVVNNLMQTVVDSGRLDGIFSYSRVIQNDWEEFFLTCKASTYCFGNILRETAVAYPDRVIGMQWSVHSANLNIRKGQIVGELTGRVNCSADSSMDSLPLFSAQIKLAVPFQVKFSRGALSARAVAWGGHAIIDQSNIGKVLSPQLLAATRMLFLPGIKQGILDIINEHETLYAFKLPRNVNFRSSRLSLHEGAVRIEASLCYKTASCQVISNNDWVGSNDIGEFKVDDVITTTTTTTTTPTPYTAVLQPEKKKATNGTRVSGHVRSTISVVNLLCCLTIVIATIL